MADCREQLELYADKIGGSARRVTMVSSEEELSSNGGIPALRQLDDQLGITRLISRALLDPRDPDRITYEQQTLIRQRVYQIAAGYEDCNDADELCHDPAFLTALALHDHGRSGSQPTLSRIEERCSEEDIARLQTAWLHHWIDQVKASGRQEVLLDFDPTDDEVHGQQQLSLWNGYYDERCYLHYLIVDSATGDILLPLLLPGTTYAGHITVNLLGILIEKIRSRLPKLSISVRMDAGFACPALFTAVERLGLRYSIALAGNPVLHRLAQEDYEAVSKHGGRLYREFLYQAETWPQARRVIAITFSRATGVVRQHFVVTDRQEPLDEVYEEYCQRGEDIENRIKEWKCQLAADRTSCHRFEANQLRLFLHVAAYALFKEMHRRLARTEFETSTIATLRLRLIKVACWIKITSRNV